MSGPLVNADEAQALLDGVTCACDDCDGAGHFLCPGCGDSSDEMCSLEHDDARHIRCERCAGQGRVPRPTGAQALAAAAPALARTVVALSDALAAAHRREWQLQRDVERVTAERDSAREAVVALTARLDAGEGGRR